MTAPSASLPPLRRQRRAADQLRGMSPLARGCQACREEGTAPGPSVVQVCIFAAHPTFTFSWADCDLALVQLESGAEQAVPRWW